MSSDRKVNRLRAMVHQLNMRFSDTMREDAQKRKIAGQGYEAPGHRSVALPANSFSESLGDAASASDDTDSSDEAQLHVSREQMIERVREESNPVVSSQALMITWRQTYRRNRGKEPPGNTNHVLLSELFHVQSSRWSKLAEAHIKRIRRVVDEFMREALHTWSKKRACVGRYRNLYSGL